MGTTHHYAAPHYSSGYRGGYYGGGLGYGGGIGLYGLGYGLGYSPLTSPGYYGGGYGGGLSYGYGGYPSGGSIGVPAIPGTYYPQYQYIPPAQPAPTMPPAVDPNAPDPTPLPLPTPNGGTPSATTALVSGGNTASAKITVLANPGAKVSFDGVASDQNGGRHSFTTKPLSKGAETRVQVKVDGSTISIGVRGGESATIDMRR
jgi:uncharacterized protein (TIGR03000 family)